MWSLPDIRRLNDEAAAKAQATRAAAAAAERKKRKPPDPCKGQKCDYCFYAGKKGRALKNAKHAEEWYDIFSDDVKGHIFTCEKHYDQWGGAHDEYFTCDECGRLYTQNYTWERYDYYDEENSRVLCLRCALKDYIAQEKNWLTQVPEEFGLETLKKAPHLIAVDSHYWEEDLVFLGNAEFDSMDGHQISGEPLEETVEEAIRKHGKCILILDAGYQFAVSFGVYVRKE